MAPEGEPPSWGLQQIPVALTLVALAWAGMTFQEVLLFLRPTPYGGLYVLHWERYFWFAILYNLLGLMLVSLPFFGFWLLRPRALSPTGTRRVHSLQLATVVLVTALDQADNEVMRFMGTHLTATLLQTYQRIGSWGADNLHSITGDHGGPFVPFIVLFLMPALIWWSGRRVIARAEAAAPAWNGIALWCGLTIPLLVPLIVFCLPGGRFRRARVEPELFTLAIEAAQSATDGGRPQEYARLVNDYRTQWARESGDSTWTFAPDTAYPLVRTATSTAAAAAPAWNVIYLQLETFRAWNVGHLHPDPRGSATPFLDSLASSPDGATWIRNLSFGPPTVSGFVAGHCSVRPHSNRNITTTFTYTSLVCLPAVLRSHGWYTAYFTGSDPDWDNQTIWLNRWYDETTYYHDADEQDRVVFRRAASRIIELGKQGKPFFATVISISNHFPFRTREPGLDLSSSAAPQEAIRNTMHYTDDVVREFVRTLAPEPWFSHTLIVVVGDHGYNLGEHDGTPGQRNGWRESVWVPLIIVGPHPRLPHGRHPEISSLLDVAPTVADLLGIRDAVPWMGRSLLLPPGPGRTVTMRRDDVVYAEDDRFGLVLNPGTGQAALYDPLTDPLQWVNIAAQHPAEVERLLRRAKDDQRLTDYLVEVNRVWPHGANRP